MTGSGSFVPPQRRMAGLSSERAASAPPSTPDQLSRFENLVGNALMARSELIKQFLDPRRSIEDECGYPSGSSPVGADVYQQLYDREGTATRVVEVLPRESWQVRPTVYESEDAGDVTPFEEAWDTLGQQLRGEASWYQDEEGSPVWEYLRRADELSGIGHFGVLLLGIDDGKELREPAEGFPVPQVRGREEGTTARFYPGVGGTTLESGTAGALAPDLPSPYASRSSSSKNGTGRNGPSSGNGSSASAALSKRRKKPPRKLLFLRVFPESLVQITRFEADPRSPRFGQPIEYAITLNDPRQQTGTGIGLTTATVNVHWSRVIHVADNLGSSEVFGVPRMRPVLNRLLDLRKLYGGSAEMYWRGAFPGFSLSTHPQLGGDVEINAPELRDMMEDYMNGLQRYLMLIGMSAQSLAPQVVDPSSQIAVQIEALCIQLGIPIRVFKGSERGELASSQDDAAWNDRLRERQRGYITPRLIVPFVDRLIALGVLPEPGIDPKSKNGQRGKVTINTPTGPLSFGINRGYSIFWPDLTSQTDQERAQIASTKTGAIAQYIGSNGASLIPEKDYLTRILGFTEEEADAILENVALAEEEQQANDLALQQEQMAMEQDALGVGPDDPFLDEGPGPPLPPEEPPPPPTGNTRRRHLPSVEDLVKLNPLANAFCPTGPGGGVDPTCSPGKSSTERNLGPDHEIALHLSREASKLTRAVKEDPESMHRNHMVPLFDTYAVYESERGNLAEAEYLHKRAAKYHQDIVSGWILPDPTNEKRYKSPSGFLEFSPEFVRKNKEARDAHIEAAHFYHDLARDLGQVQNVGPRQSGGPRRPFVGNVFCPTGPGGGVDPSCSPEVKRAQEVLEQFRQREAGKRGTPEERQARREAERVARKVFRATIRQAAAEVFGKENVERHEGGDLTISLRDRRLGVEVDEEKRLVSLDFSQVSNLPAQSSKGEYGHAWAVTGRSLQKGSIDFAHQLQDFLGRLKGKGIGVEYEAEPRRARLYGKVLKGAGFEQVGEGRWKPVGNAFVPLLPFLLANVFCPTGRGGGVDPSCSPASSGSYDVLDIGKNPAEIARHAEQLFGRGWTHADFARAVGAPIGSTVSVRPDTSVNGVTVSVRTPDLSMLRTLFLDKQGRRVCENILIEVENQGKGVGSRIFSDQAEFLAAKGFDRIKCDAARSYEKGPGAYVGYYTWPRLGYDAPLNDQDTSKELQRNGVLVDLLRKFPNAQRVSDLMQTPEGRAWWKEKGIALPMEFKLSPNPDGSTPLSLRVLRAYMAAKGRQ